MNTELRRALEDNDRLRVRAALDEVREWTKNGGLALANPWTRAVVSLRLILEAAARLHAARRSRPLTEEAR